ncbi:MAG TPA: response regulator transcription factor [Aeromicrobium sp.]|nr:response regulator transcription factor [Aeromicrobium sp.]HKY58390.1 response regulator transcription factor [Aeromicrobium sp.]
MTEATHVLVVDDDPDLLSALAITLRAHHYVVHTARTGTEGLEVAAQHPPDIAVIDLGLPDMEGTTVIERLRAWTDAPILVLSGRADSLDKVEALDAGADDYVTKPFAADELLARLRAAARRAPTSDASPVVEVGGATVDLAARRVTKAGLDVHLTPTEWQLLEVFVRNPGKLLSRQTLLRSAWGPGYESAAGSLRLYMAQLRRKLEDDPARPKHLLNEPGLGYRFQP